MRRTRAKQKRKNIWTLGAVLFMTVFFAPRGALAFNSTSPNFISQHPAISIFGFSATATNFTQLNTGGQIVTGESTSPSFILRFGFVYLENFSPKSQNWRWYNDEYNETPIFPLAAENTAPADVEDMNIIKLRLAIKETGGKKGKNIKFKLQFSENSDFSQEVRDVVEMGNCALDSLWCYAAGAGWDNSIISAELLSEVHPCTSGFGPGCGTHNTSGISSSTFTQLANKTTEYEFTIKPSGAKANTTYFFRPFAVADNKPVPANMGQSYPSIAIKGAILTFSVAGLPAATFTEGIVTNVASTPVGIPFGNLNFDVQYVAAQRLFVTTNAAHGYQVFIFQDQGLSGPAEIASVLGTNESPSAWAIPLGAAGAYGYHAGDDVLAGGSPRFAPDNTYAKFETEAKEVAYSSGPAGNRLTDIVFKLQITNQQEAGSYNNSIAYIIVPEF